MASAKDNRVKNAILDNTKKADKANSEIAIMQNDIEQTHFDLLKKIEHLTCEVECLKKTIEEMGQQL